MLRLLSPDALQTLRSSLHCSCCFQGPCRSRRRECGIAPPTFMLNASGAWTQAPSRRSLLLGSVVSLLEWLEGKSGGGEASHGFGLASQGGGSEVSEWTLLAVEEPDAWSRTTSNPHRSSKADHPDGRNECRLTRKLHFLPPRVHGELLKLGIAISEITVSRYMPKRPAPAGSRQRWATFLRNHLHEILAVDLPGRFLIRDNGKIYGMKFRNRVDGLGLRQIRTAFRSP